VLPVEEELPLEGVLEPVSDEPLDAGAAFSVSPEDLAVSPVEAFDSPEPLLAAPPPLLP
jgi:hypothetical protein